MPGCYHKFLRAGSVKNTNLEVIYNNLKQALGSAYNSEDDTNYINVELFAYAKELDAINDYNEYILNQKNPLKVTDYIDDLEKIYGISNSELPLYDRQKQLSVYMRTFKNPITFNLLDEMLKILSPNVYMSIYLFHASGQTNWLDKALVTYPAMNTDTYTTEFGIDAKSGYPEYPEYPNYLCRNQGIETEVNPVINGASTHGLTYNYIIGINDRWFSSLFQIGIQINTSIIDNNQLFNQEIIKMTNYLNKFLPAHLSFSVFRTHNFQLGISKLGSYDVL